MHSAKDVNIPPPNEQPKETYHEGGDEGERGRNASTRGLASLLPASALHPTPCMWSAAALDIIPLLLFFWSGGGALLRKSDLPGTIKCKIRHRSIDRWSFEKFYAVNARPAIKCIRLQPAYHHPSINVIPLFILCAFVVRGRGRKVNKY